MSEDPELARSAVGVAHEQDFKCLLALRGDAGLALVHEFMPEAVVVSRELPQVDGEAVLDHLKRHPQTRHIPVYVLAEGDRAHEARRSGAVGFAPKPLSPRAARRGVPGARRVPRPAHVRGARRRGRRARARGA